MDLKILEIPLEFSNNVSISAVTPINVSTTQTMTASLQANQTNIKSNTITFKTISDIYNIYTIRKIQLDTSSQTTSGLIVLQNLYILYKLI